jgi:thioredoxin reductase (NADPH)
MKYHTDIAIIGAGPAGLFSAFEAGMLKMKCHVIDTLDSIGGQCIALYPEKPIYDIPAHPCISAKELIKKLEEQAAPFNPTYHLGQQVVELIRQKDRSFIIITSKNNKIHAKAVIIAAGCGAFGPNRPPVEGIEKFENKSIFYAVKNSNDFAEKNVVIAGGGDSAVDWAIVLADIAKSVTIVHRRSKFRCAPENSDKLHDLSKKGKIVIETPYQLHKIHGQNGIMHSIEIIDFDNNIKTLEADILLPFFGLSMDLGPILNWQLVLNNKHIKVDSATLQTNVPGVFAVGDIVTYPGKLKLILTGFSEAAVACHSIYPIIYPDQALHFEYSTTKGITADG